MLIRSKWAAYSRATVVSLRLCSLTSLTACAQRVEGDARNEKESQYGDVIDCIYFPNIWNKKTSLIYNAKNMWFSV